MILDKPLNKVTGSVTVVMEPTYHYTYNLIRFYKVEVESPRRSSKNSRIDRNYLYIPESIIDTVDLVEGTTVEVEGSLVTARVQNRLKSVAVLVSSLKVVNPDDIDPESMKLKVLISGTLTSMSEIDTSSGSESRKFQVEVPLEDGSKYVLPRVSAFGKYARDMDKFSIGQTVYVSSILYSYKIKGARTSKGGSHLQYLRLLAMTEVEHLSDKE